jgi:hypothetical protein
MGLSSTLLGPLAERASSVSAGVLIASTIGTFITLAIILNVLNQLLLKNPKEPPVVFHWVPFFGSTITYGIDPFKFFFACREKVSSLSCTSTYGQ